MVSIVDHPGHGGVLHRLGGRHQRPLPAAGARPSARSRRAARRCPETETAAGLGWAFSISLPSTLPEEHTMSVWGLPNVLRILDDIDKGKLQRYTFIECHACFEGCVSGALTVENPYVARARALRLQQSLPKRDLVDAGRDARPARARRVPDDGALRRPAPAARSAATSSPPSPGCRSATAWPPACRASTAAPAGRRPARPSPRTSWSARPSEAQCVVLRQGQLEEQLARLAAQRVAASRDEGRGREVRR